MNALIRCLCASLLGAFVLSCQDPAMDNLRDSDTDSASSQLECTEQSLGEALREFAATHSACTRDVDCVLIGRDRVTCNCQPELWVAIASDALDAAQPYITRLDECFAVGFSWVCDDFYLSHTAACDGTSCYVQQSDLQSCLPWFPDAAVVPDAAL